MRLAIFLIGSANRKELPAAIGGFSRGRVRSLAEQTGPERRATASGRHTIVLAR